MNKVKDNVIWESRVDKPRVYLAEEYDSVLCHQDRNKDKYYSSGSLHCFPRKEETRWEGRFTDISYPYPHPSPPPPTEEKFIFL